MTVLSADIHIDAPRDHVWSILYDIRRYNDWNPFTFDMQSSLQPGLPLSMRVRMSPTWTRVDRSIIVEVEPPHLISWRFAAPAWLIDTLRVQRLEVLGPRRTRYETTNAFGGLLGWVAVQQYRTGIQQGLNDVCTALKSYAELTYTEKRYAPE